MVPRRVYLYIILANGTPQSVPLLAPTFKIFKIFLMPDRAHFFLSDIILNGDSSSRPSYFSFKRWKTSFWRLVSPRVNLYVILANDTPQSVPRLAPMFSIFYMPYQTHFIFPIVCSYYYLRWHFKFVYLLFIERVLCLKLANDTPQRVSLCHFLANSTPQSVPQVASTITISIKRRFFCQLLFIRMPHSYIYLLYIKPRFGKWYPAECIYTSFWRVVPRRMYRDSPQRLNYFYAPSGAFFW